jgi:hypothetical protein
MSAYINALVEVLFIDENVGFFWLEITPLAR